MTPEQFERLVQAIEANTLAQREVAAAMFAMADETAAMVAAYTGEDEDEEQQPATDMAGRPIISN